MQQTTSVHNSFVPAWLAMKVGKSMALCTIIFLCTVSRNLKLVLRFLKSLVF